MIYIPVIGFVYAAVRVGWAQWMLHQHRMTLDQEWPYFDQFETAFLVTMGSVLACLVYCLIRSSILRERLARLKREAGERDAAV